MRAENIKAYEDSFYAEIIAEKDYKVVGQEYISRTGSKDTKKTFGGSVITDIVPSDLDSKQLYYHKEVSGKRSICLHYTAGYIKGDVKDLTHPKDSGSVAYVVDRSGRIYRLFDDSYWAFHLGHDAIGGNEEMSKSSIAIEVSNIGYLSPHVITKKVNGKDVKINEYLTAYTKSEVYVSNDSDFEAALKKYPGYKKRVEYVKDESLSTINGLKEKYAIKKIVKKVISSSDAAKWSNKVGVVKVYNDIYAEDDVDENGCVIQSGEVTTLSTKYRGYIHYAKMPLVQVEALCSLIKYLQGNKKWTHSMKADQWPWQIGLFKNKSDAENFNGIFCHTSVRKSSKLDFPDEIMKTIKMVYDGESLYSFIVGIISSLENMFAPIINLFESKK